VLRDSFIKPTLLAEVGRPSKRWPFDNINKAQSGVESCPGGSNETRERRIK
jgi:hypothetical protein